MSTLYVHLLECLLNVIVLIVGMCGTYIELQSQVLLKEEIISQLQQQIEDSHKNATYELEEVSKGDME